MHKMVSRRVTAALPWLQSQFIDFKCVCEVSLTDWFLKAVMNRRHVRVELTLVFSVASCL